MFRFRILVVAIGITIPALTVAQTEDLERELSQALVSKQVKLKMPLSGSQLKFDSNGKKLKGERGVFGLDDRILVNSVSVRDRELRIKGIRIITMVNPDTSATEFGENEPVDVRIELPTSEISSSSVESALKQVFATPLEIEARKCSPEEASLFHVPSYKTVSVRSKPVPEQAPIACMPTGGRGFRIAKNTSPPKPISTPDPQFPIQLRKQNVREMLIILCARIDESGTITDVVPVSKPGVFSAIGAAEVLRKWKFKPATVDGKAVPFLMNVEMSLRLH